MWTEYSSPPNSTQYAVEVSVLHMGKEATDSFLQKVAEFCEESRFCSVFLNDWRYHENI